MPKASELKCFFGCNIDGPLHRFPKWAHPHTDKFDQWKCILDKATQERGNNFIYNSVRICHRHFEDYFKLPSRRLTQNAIPTLNLASQSAQNIIQLSNEQLMKPPTSDLQQPKVETKAQQFEGETELSHVKVEPEPIAISSAPKKRSLKQRSNLISRLSKKLLKMRQKCKMQTKKILSAKKLAMSTPLLSSIEKLPEASQTFIKLQLRWKNKPRGRRYTTEEKNMALSILKQSPEAYTFLKKMFVLPSTRCLQKYSMHSQ